MLRVGKLMEVHLLLVVPWELGDSQFLILKESEVYSCWAVGMAKHHAWCNHLFHFLDEPKNVMSSSGWRFQSSQRVWNTCERYELLKGH